MSLIALTAVGLDNSIGYNGNLLWHLPEDLKHYKNLTTNNILVVGNNTYKTLPEKAKLNRFHCVISNTDTGFDDLHKYFKSVDDFLDYYNAYLFDKNVYVVGGQQIYDQLVLHCDKAIITTVCKLFTEANKYFPMAMISTNFLEVKTTGKLLSVNGLEYIIREYKRV